MLQKIGKKLSTSRQTSSKQLAELQKRHTEGELTELSELHSNKKGRVRKRITSSTTSNDFESKLPSSSSESKLPSSPPL